MKVLFLLSLLLAGVFCTSLQHQLTKDLFDQWKLHHKKSYKAGFEEQLRFNIFSQNYLKIQEFNQMQDHVLLGLNHLADLTTEEFRTLYTGYNRGSSRSNAVGVAEVAHVKDIPASIDWRDKGAVTPVKNSWETIWTFSTVNALEDLYFINPIQKMHLYYF